MKDGDRCCGSAGIYNLTQPEMAERLGEQKAANVADTRADVVVSGNPGCLIQLRAALGHAGPPRARCISPICSTPRIGTEPPKHPGERIVLLAHRCRASALALPRPGRWLVIRGAARPH